MAGAAELTRALPVAGHQVSGDRRRAELARMLLVELELCAWSPGQRRSPARPSPPASWSSSTAAPGHRIGGDRRRGRPRRHGASTPGRRRSPAWPSSSARLTFEPSSAAGHQVTRSAMIAGAAHCRAHAGDSWRGRVRWRASGSARRLPPDRRLPIGNRLRTP